MIKGFTWGFFAGEGGFKTDEACASMDRLISDGINWICITVNCFQESFSSLTIFPMFGRTQTDEEILLAIKRAKDQGIKVCLKPMVDCLDRAWRARIHFPEQNPYYWDRWFESYTRFMLHYARLAESAGVDMLCTGCEMAGMDSQADRCVTMVSKVREVFSGLIMHNINHGDELRFPWLSAVDVVGISAYYPVTDGINISREVMLENWNKRKEKLIACHELYKKPIMFAEIGMMSEHGFSKKPWEFVHDEGAAFDEEEQAMFYDTCMEAMWDEDWFAGFFWWDWKPKLPPIERMKEIRDFNIYGKKAEEVLKKWYLNK